MKIKRLKISNLKAFKEMELTLERLTTICGRNGRGKSTVLDAINFLLNNGVEGEKVDGRNILSLVPDKDSALIVEADIEYNGITARCERRRDPTASGLGRSKVAIDVPDGVDARPWQMALEGRLASVSHVHEWLTLSKPDLLKMIASLADEAQLAMSPEVSAQLEKLSGSLTSRLNALSAQLKSDELEAKREHRALSQTIEGRRAMPSGSPEELAALTARQREAVSKKTDLQSRHNALHAAISRAEGQLSTYGRLVVPSDFDLAEAEIIVTPEWLAAHWDASQQALLLRNKLRDELSALRDCALAGSTCSKCGQSLPVAAPQDIDYQIIVKQSELDDAETALLSASEQARNAGNVQMRTRAIIHAYKSQEDKMRLEAELVELRGSAEIVRAELDSAETAHLDVYKRMVDMQNALSTQRLFAEGELELGRLAATIADCSRMSNEVQMVLATMARFGRDALEARVRNYYSAELGAPAVNLELGRIGLQRNGYFYDGVALSGAERDLLATAIDCAMKDLSKTPKIILLEADSVDPDNLSQTLSCLKQRIDAGEVEQVILATWYPIAPIEGMSIITL